MKTNDTKLLSLLSNNDVTFFIPPYQRNYEWETPQCEVFFDDIKKTCENNLSGEYCEHFFGSITYNQEHTHFGEPDKLILIDGQQRLTSTMLFLVAARDLIEDEVQKKYINTKYLQNNNSSDETNYKIKLKQVENDWQSYKNLITGQELTDDDKNSNVYNSYNYFLKRINFYAEGDASKIYFLIEKGLSYFSIVTVELEPEKNKWENPQEIFESMNSMGKPLSLADLVRNYLLLGLNSNEQTQLYNKYWLNIEKMVPKNVSQFIRDYMQIKKRMACKQAGDSNHKHLYSEFKTLFINESPVEIIKDLSNYANIYACVSLGNTTGNQKIDRLLLDFRTLKISTAYSFITELLYQRKIGIFTDDDIINIFEAFFVYCTRKRIIGETKAENNVFPKLINKINILKDSKNKKQTTFDILSNLDFNMRLYNDIELKNQILRMNFYNFAHCRFLLSLIEEKLTKGRPSLIDKNISIEHIMPQTLNEYWKDKLGENYEDIHVEYLNLIGNLTLIRHNSELGNKKFEEKKKTYEESEGFQIAKTKIINNENWTEKEIKERSEWLASYLVETVLPIPDEKRKRNNYDANGKRGLSFVDLGLIGEEIVFIENESIKAKVVSDNEVELDGKIWKLAPLTKELKIKNGTANPLGSYQGAKYWKYDDMLLIHFI